MHTRHDARARARTRTQTHTNTHTHTHTHAHTRTRTRTQKTRTHAYAHAHTRVQTYSARGHQMSKVSRTSIALTSHVSMSRIRGLFARDTTHSYDMTVTIVAQHILSVFSHAF